MPDNAFDHEPRIPPAARGRSLCAAFRGLAVVLLALAVAPAARAEPFVPATDDVVLETLPPGAAGSELRELRELRAELAKDPSNLELATRTAWRLVRLARTEGDPRFSGYAEAALAPWWPLEDPPAEVLLLRATLRQHVHDFTAAIADLDRLLEIHPERAEAWLTRAVVLQVEGDLAGARASCEPLRLLADNLTYVACATGVESVRGEGEASYQALFEAFRATPPKEPAKRQWVLTSLAEMAERLGRDAAAETHFAAALAIDRRDVYLLAAYADFLLDRDRSAEVLRRLDGEERVDALLERLVEAEQRLGAPAFAAHTASLDDRFAAARRRGETTHRGDESRFRLRVQGRAGEALRLALANWQAQREPRDARRVLEAAVAAGCPEAARPVLDWLDETEIEDVHLAALAQRLEGGRS
ncbi:MAG: hypothetical protein KDD11_08055 [Acidobacteria bacterium]|nr:hypothetical protein [Acidobacteriota bacterium]